MSVCPAVQLLPGRWKYLFLRNYIARGSRQQATKEHEQSNRYPIHLEFHRLTQQSILVIYDGMNYTVEQ